MSDDKIKPVITKYNSVFDGSFLGGSASIGASGQSVLFRTEQYATWSAGGEGLGKANSWVNKKFYGGPDQVVDTSKLDLSGLSDPAKLIDRIESRISSGVQVYRDGRDKPITELTVDLPKVDDRVSCERLKKSEVAKGIAERHGEDALGQGQQKCRIPVKNSKSFD